MAHEPPLDLVAGESLWLRLTRYGLFVSAAPVLAFAATDAIWRLTGLALLGLVFVLVGFKLRQMSQVRSLHLLGDGMITLSRTDQPDIHASLGQDGWATAWIAIVPVIRADHRAPMRVLVCRSQNHPADYRRLLGRMRLGFGSTPGNGILDRP